MKKVLLVAGAVLLLTGCGNTLTCTRTEDDGKAVVKISFNKDDKPTSYVLEATAKETKAAKEIYDEYKDSEGFKVKRSGKKVTVIADKDHVKQLQDAGYGKEFYKQALELGEYTCK